MEVHGVDVLRAYRTLDLLAGDALVRFTTGPGRGAVTGGRTWHPETGDGCYLDDPGTETVTIDEALRILDLSAADRHRPASVTGPSRRTLCDDATETRWAPVTDADHDAVCWLAGAHRILDSAAIRGDDVTDALWSATTDTVPDNPTARGATHPAILAAVAAARNRLHAQIPTVTPTSERWSILASYLPLHLDLLATGLAADLDELCPDELRSIAHEVAATRHGRHEDALITRAWEVFTRVKVWRLPDETFGAAHHRIVYDYHPGTGLTLTPAAGDHRLAADGNAFCLDDGYTAAEVAAAARVLNQTPAPLAARNQAVADFIAAHRASQLPGPGDPAP